MLEYNEVKEGKVIIMDDEPWLVLASHVFRKQQRKPVNATKLKNMITGRVTEQSFGVSEKVREADIGEKEVKYLYTNRGEWWFSEANDPSKRFTVPEDQLGPQSKFLKQNSVVKAILFDENIIGVKLPIKVELKVVEAHPAVKGNTAQGGTKAVKLETGAEIQVPMFIKEGDVLRINTETGQYTERVGSF